MSDRLADLLASSTLNGIDFVEIFDDAQTALRGALPQHASTGRRDARRTARVTITGGESVPTVPVTRRQPGPWTTTIGRRSTSRRLFPGDFSFYTLSICELRP